MLQMQVGGWRGKGGQGLLALSKSGVGSRGPGRPLSSGQGVWQSARVVFAMASSQSTLMQPFTLCRLAPNVLTAFLCVQAEGRRANGYIITSMLNACEQGGQWERAGQLFKAVQVGLQGGLLCCLAPCGNPLWQLLVGSPPSNVLAAGVQLGWWCCAQVRST